MRKLVVSLIPGEVMVEYRAKASELCSARRAGPE